MLPRGSSVAVGLSGGPDSMCLAHVLHGLRDELGITLRAVHVNHNLRGEGAKGDERAVSEWCGSLGIPLTVVGCDVGARAAASGESLEMAGRNARYAVFADLADSLGITRVALGHNADDMAETVLINLVRGAGVQGLSGIPPVRELREGVTGVKVVRPLIGTSRQAIEAYCSEEGLPVRIDPSNADGTFLRNRVRHGLLPLLEGEYNPGIRKGLAQTADVLREEDDLLDTLVDEALARVLRPGTPMAPAIAVDAFSGLHTALQRRILRRLLGGMGVAPGFERLEAVRGLVHAPGGTLVQVGKGVTALRRGNGIVLSADGVGDGQRAATPGPFGFRLPVPGTVTLPDGRVIRAETADGIPENPDAGRNRVFLDADLVGPDLLVRSRRNGDRFVPFGMKGEVKLKDFLNGAKVCQAERSGVPIVESKYGICWISGYRPDDRFRVSPRTERVLSLTLESPIGNPDTQ